MDKTYIPSEVNTDEDMARHLWRANCSVCSKIANRLIELSTVAQLVDKEVNQALDEALQKCAKEIRFDTDDSYDIGWKDGVDRCMLHVSRLKRT